MATFRKHFEKLLYDNGMFENQASAIMDKVIAEDNVMGGRWNDEAEGYPPAMKAVLQVSVWRAADEWLAVNAPKHWARPMFNREMMAAIEAENKDKAS